MKHHLLWCALTNTQDYVYNTQCIQYIHIPITVAVGPVQWITDKRKSLYDERTSY